MRPFARFNPDEELEPRDRDAAENAVGFDQHERELFPSRDESFDAWLKQREEFPASNRS